jgi:cytochrome c556
MKRVRIARLFAAFRTIITGAACAQADAIKYRQRVYRVMGWSFGPMVAMAKGEKPDDRQGLAIVPR